MLNIIEFADNLLHPNKLFVPQKVVLKLLYGLELDERELKIASRWGVKPGEYNTLILEAGRGATKTTLALLISLYELYSLIQNPNFREEYNLIPDCPLHILIFVKSQIEINQGIYSSIRNIIKGSNYFQGFNVNDQYIKHEANKLSILPKDIDTSALVGYNIKCSVIDEVSRIDYPLVRNLIDNVTKPGLRRFPFGSAKSIYTGSALKKGDSLEKLKESADENTLVLSISTWELNTSINSDQYYKDEFLKHPERFLLEYENIRYN